MNTDASTVKLFGLTFSQAKLNAVAGILGIYGLGIFLTWYIPALPAMEGRSSSRLGTPQTLG